MDIHSEQSRISFESCGTLSQRKLSDTRGYRRESARTMEGCRTENAMQIFESIASVPGFKFSEPICLSNLRTVFAAVNDAGGAASRSLARSLTAAARDAFAMREAGTEKRLRQAEQRNDRRLWSTEAQRVQHCS